MTSLHFQCCYILCFMIGLAISAKCPPIIKHSIVAQCKYKGNEFPCTKSVEPETIAHIKCAFMYKHTSLGEYLRCQSDGTWNSSPFECEPICGTIGSKVAFSVNSQITEVQKVPWQAAIYMKDSNEMFHHICGGTIVKSNVIISAAHCFWDPLTSQLYNESNYIVAVGKFYRNFYANSETSVVQISNVSNIKIPASFSGADYDFVSDIAVVTLKNHIIFKNHIRPACLPWNVDKYSFAINNKSGVVAGWGVTNTGTYSPELRSVELTSIDSDDCKKKVTKDNKIPNDKFCVNIDEGKNVCRGDSGGGFLVPITRNNSTYYHLWGIVSNGLIDPAAGAIICNSKFVTTFTNVELYQAFITQLKVFDRNDEYIGCLVPRVPYLYIKNAETGHKLFSDTYVQKFTKIKYECAYPIIYKFVGNYTTNTCEENWINPHPKCSLTCSALKKHSLHPRCYYEGEQINCTSERVLPGTIAKVECAFMYKKPHNKLFHETITCGKGGFWDNLPTECEQICGTTEHDLKTELITTESINRRVPWQVSIYVKKNEEYEYTCTGTLIHSKVVLTAARCFWDSKNSTFHNTSNYIVRAGNFYRYYYATEIDEVQSSNISDIYIIDSIWSLTNNYAFEIAVLSLKDHIIFKNHIRPACLKSVDQENTNDQLAVLADWRVSDMGIYNSELCSIDLLNSHCEKCDKNSPNRSFCVNEIKYCSGDNGSGLFVPQIINNVTYYYLFAIVSNNLQIQKVDLDECNSKIVITFNNILHFKTIIDESIRNATRYD